MFLRTPLKTVGNARYIFTRRSYQEVQIPVPWGHIAGKWWGPEDKRPILALHGWQDNSGTFDTLTPLLPKHIPILALDFPGHGCSSYIPSGMPHYNGSFNKVILIKRLAQYFGWKKLSLMGHSLGSVAAYTYAFLFPSEVDFLMCLDGLYPLTYPNEYDRVAKCIELFIKYDELNDSKVEPPAYTYAETEEKTHEGSHLYTYKSVDVSSAKYLLARNLKPSKLHPGRFCFKRDPRIKVGQLELHNPEELIRYASRIRCPILVTKTATGPFWGNVMIFRNVLAAIKGSSEDCQFYEVPGTHHVHLNEPEVIAGLVNDFIEKHDFIEERSYSGIKEEMKVAEDVYDFTLGKLEEIKLGGRLC